jgi:acetyl-CoA C-acetyltransferase
MTRQSGDVVIVGAARTPIGKFQGGLSTVPAPRLGAVAIQGALQRAHVDPGTVDEVIMGNVISAGLGQAPARQAALGAGLPPTVTATTVNKVCGSGLKAVMLATQAIRCGDASVVVAGGMENMSLGPYLLLQARTGYRLGNAELVDATVHDGLWCALENWHMGMAAEAIAERFAISREDQDAFAVHSHQKAVRAMAAGVFGDEIVPVPVPQKKGDAILITNDECPRPDTSLDKLAALKPAFKANGTVTAGNAPGITDGAAALVLASTDYAERHHLQPLARVLHYCAAGTEPRWLFYAPVLVIRKLMEIGGYHIGDFDLIEINEAFAAQVLVNGRELGWDWDRVNVHGGAIALGHPIGASGARILTTLLYALRRYRKHLGLAALCLGGGEAVAMAVERVD